MNFQIRKLEIDDLEAILSLSKLRTKYMTLPKEEIQKIYGTSWPKDRVAISFESQFLTELKSHYLNHSFLYQIFGAFSEGQRLTAVLGMNFSSSRPLWTLSRMINDPTKNIRDSGLGDLYEYCIGYAESLGIADYLTCIPFRLAKVYDRAWKGAAPGRFRYEIFVEEFVEANTRPFYAHHFKTMGFAPWPIPIVIRRHSLLGKQREIVVRKREKLPEVFAEKFGIFAPISQSPFGECRPNFN